jgi:acylphosphatase
VQGVGFRYTTRRIATRFDVTGYVRNLPDGQVLVVAEGQPEEVKRFLSAVKAEMGSCIEGTRESVLPPTGEFPRFEIRH